MSDVKENKPEGLLDKMLNFFKEKGEERVVKRFHKRLNRKVNETVIKLNGEIEKIKEKIEDQNEVVNEAIVKVDIDRAKDLDGLDNYVESFVANYNNCESSLAQLKDELSDLQDQLATAKIFMDKVK